MMGIGTGIGELGCVLGVPDPAKSMTGDFTGKGQDAVANCHFLTQ